MPGPYYTNTKIDGVDTIAEADLEAIESGFSSVDTDKANKAIPVATNDFAALSASGDLVDSGKTPPTGEVVGETDTQTLTNKTLTSPTISGPSMSGTVSGSLTWSGAQTFSSNVTINGNTTLGNAASDNITVNGDFVGHMTPNTTNSYDMGTASLSWRDGFFDRNVDVGGTFGATGVSTFQNNVIINGNTTLGNAATDTVTVNADIASNLLPSAASTYDLGFTGAEWDGVYATTLSTTTTVSVGTTLTVSGVSDLNGDVNLGNQTTDSITATGRFDSDILPITDSLYDLGSASNAWAQTHTDSLYLGGTLVSSTAAELNLLDGVTATTAQLNYLNTTTSDVQTQIDTKYDSSDLGVAVQAYDADTAKYDDVTANFTGTLQNGGSNVVVDTDIGTNVQAYDADIATVAASQLEMQTGTETAVRSMSPLRVAEAIAALSAPGGTASFTANGAITAGDLVYFDENGHVKPTTTTSSPDRYRQNMGSDRTIQSSVTNEGTTCFLPYGVNGGPNLFTMCNDSDVVHMETGTIGVASWTSDDTDISVSGVTYREGNFYCDCAYSPVHDRVLLVADDNNTGNTCDYHLISINNTTGVITIDESGTLNGGTTGAYQYIRVISINDGDWLVSYSLSGTTYVTCCTQTAGSLTEGTKKSVVAVSGHLWAHDPIRDELIGIDQNNEWHRVYKTTGTTVASSSLTSTAPDYTLTQNISIPPVFMTQADLYVTAVLSDSAMSGLAAFKRAERASGIQMEFMGFYPLSDAAYNTEVEGMCYNELTGKIYLWVRATANLMHEVFYANNGLVYGNKHTHTSGSQRGLVKTTGPKTMPALVSYMDDGGTTMSVAVFSEGYNELDLLAGIATETVADNAAVEVQVTGLYDGWTELIPNHTYYAYDLPYIGVGQAEANNDEVSGLDIKRPLVLKKGSIQVGHAITESLFNVNIIRDKSFSHQAMPLPLTGIVNVDGGSQPQLVINGSQRVVWVPNGTPTLTLDTQFTQYIPTSGFKIELFIWNGGSFTITFPAWAWQAASAPTLSTSKWDKIVLECIDWRGNASDIWATEYLDYLTPTEDF
jgi:hypothetical protein